MQELSSTPLRLHSWMFHDLRRRRIDCFGRDVDCLELPVCGCNGVTYSNVCEAMYVEIHTWTLGVCEFTNWCMAALTGGVQF